MTRPRVRVVGLGPAGADLVTEGARRALAEAPVARLRTRVHPAAAAFPGVPSYDDRYESAGGFDDLYAGIVEDLVALAAGSPSGEVVYAVPGSPVVAERTVELLVARDDVEVVLDPAVSVIDLACAALRVDPMAAGLRVADALAGSALAGPGPVLVLQAYSPEVLAALADAVPAGAPVTVLHHLGLEDEVVEARRAPDLAFARADHLTSLWVGEWPSPAASVAALASLAHRLRLECPWDAEQSHGSLTRHLLEEAYEAIDALEALARADEAGAPDPALVDHAVEELGDLLYQVVAHAELGAEEGRFDLSTVATRESEKLVSRHPHVFGDARAASAREVEERWEHLKRAEKGRDSALDGVVWDLPALTLYAKLLSRARHAGLDARALGGRSDDDGLVDSLVALCAAARDEGLDLEGALRARALALADALRVAEARGGAGGRAVALTRRHP